MSSLIKTIRPPSCSVLSSQEILNEKLKHFLCSGHFLASLQWSLIYSIYGRLVWLFSNSWVGKRPKIYLRIKTWNLMKTTGYPSSCYKLLILLIKLIASFPEPLRFKYNPPLFSSFEVIFPLSMISICKPYKCSFVLIIVKPLMPGGNQKVIHI